MRRIALVVLGGAGLVALAWMWQRSEPEAAPVPRAAPVGEASPSSRHPPTPASLPSSAPTAVAAEPSPASEEPAARAPLVAAEGAGPHFVLRVVDEHEQPVAEAEVCFLDLEAAIAESPWSEPEELLGLDLDGLCARIGHAYRTNEEGLVRIAKNDLGGLALARQGGRAALTICGPLFDHDSDPAADEEQTLVLRAELALDVRVLDGAGAPAADVPVALRLRGEEEVVDSFGARTDARGLAHLAHLQVMFENGLDVVEGACVALDVLALRPVEIALRAGPLPGEPIELTLPPCGSLELQLVDGAGRPLAIDAWIELELAPSGPRTSDEEWRRKYLGHRGDDRRQKVFARGGHALVAPLGLALELELRVQPLQGYRPCEQRARGPLTAGERALVRIPVLERQAMLAATLRTSGGAPFAERELEGSLWLEAAEGGRGRGLALHTDRAGRFELTLDTDWPLTGTFTLELHRDEPEVGRWSLRKEWPATLAPGVNELGELAIALLPVLAAGRVVDAAGAPLAGARVALAAFPPGGRDWITSAVSDAGGRFRLQGIVAAPELELELGHEGFSPRRIEVANGASDVVLALSPGGGLEGSVQVNDERALAALRATATSASGEVSETELVEQGRFVFADLAPGDYTVALTLAAEPEFECRVPGVRVEPGASTSDPRLQGLDLRSRLRTFGVTLRSPDGETTLWCFVRRRAAGTPTYANAGDWSLDDPIFTTSHPALDLRLTVEDRRTVELLAVAEERSVELQPALAVALRLVPPVPLGEDEWLELELDPLDGAPLPKLFGPRFFDGENAAALLPEGGRYAVRLNFLQPGADDLHSLPLPLAPEAVLRVAEGDEPQAFELALPPSALAAIATARAAPPPRKP